MKAEIEVFPGRDELAVALAAGVRRLAAEAVAARGRFRLAVAGGAVVSLLGRGLARAQVEASNWDVFWADERCVPRTDPESNFRLAGQELFPGLRIPRDCIHAADGARGPDEAARAYAADLARVFSLGADDWPRFDLVLLGIGEDGHVASLFPGNPALSETRRRVAPVRNAPKPPPERITLTLPVINHARHIFVVAAGAGKAGALSRVFAPGNRAPVLPAQMLRPADGELGWLIDRAAAANLPEPLWTPQPIAEEQP